MVVLGERLMAQPPVVLYRCGELILAYLNRGKFPGLGLCFLKTGKNGSITFTIGESGIDAHTYEVSVRRVLLPQQPPPHEARRARQALSIPSSISPDPLLSRPTR